MFQIHNIIFFFGIVLFTLSTAAQTKVGVIKDSDGFVNIREGAGNTFAVLAKIEPTDLFYFSNQENSEWQQIRIFKEKPIRGFVHKGKIQEFKKLKDKDQQELIITTLKRQIELAIQFNEALDSKNEKLYFTTRNILENHSEAQYDIILNILPNYFCRTEDQEVLRNFLLTILENKNSANENVAHAIGQSFICNSGLIIAEIGKLKNSEFRNHIYSQIEWGLLNHFDSDDKDFLKLKSVLDKAKMESKIR